MHGGPRFLLATALFLGSPGGAMAQQAPPVPAGTPDASSPVAGQAAGEVTGKTEFTQRDLQDQAGALVQELKKTVDGLTLLTRAANQRHDNAEFYRLSQCQYQHTILLMVAGETFNRLYALPPSLLTNHPPSAAEMARDPFLGSGRNPQAERNFGQALAYSTVIANTVAMARNLGATCGGSLPEVRIIGLP